MTDFADALAYAIESGKERRALPVVVQAATGRVTLTTIQRVTPRQPERARLVDAAACLLNVTTAVAKAEVDLWLSGAYTLADMLEQHADAAASASDAWELLAARGVIPIGWIDDPRRVFEHRPTEPLVRHVDHRDRDIAITGTITADTGSLVLLPHPGTVAACIAFAADVSNVIEVETIARETVRRAQRIVWRVDTDYHAALMRDHQRVPAWWDPLHALGYAFGGSDDTSATLVAPELGT